MPFTQNDLARSHTRTTSRAPIATVFGGGIAGLSTAHELIERGFTVQVVEAWEDFDEEYACRVGGMAANQYGRIPGELEDLHPYLFAPQRGGHDRSDLPSDGSSGVWVWLVPTNPRLPYQYVSIGTRLLRRRVPSPPGTTPRVLKRALMAVINSFAGYQATAHPTEPLTFVVTSSDPLERPDVRVEEETSPGDFKLSGQVQCESTSGIAPLRACAMQPVQMRAALAQRIQLDRSVVPGTLVPWLSLLDDHGTANTAKLDAVLRQLRVAYRENRQAFARLRAQAQGDVRLSTRMERREVLLVELRGHTDGDDEKDRNRILSLKWAELVKVELVRLDSIAAPADRIPDLALRLVAVGVGSAEPIGNPHREAGRRRDNRVELRIVENRIPGEHGYRYFPGFYRHLFDTMKRTPILDANGHETGDTAYDQLVPTETIDLALSSERALSNERAPETIAVRRPRSLEDLRKLVRLHLDPERLGVKERDLLRFQVRLLKFLTACPERRAKWEDISWWDFLGGPGYSKRMQQILKNTPEALIAMNAFETDAHSQGLIYLHILIESLGDGAPANRTLNGPTTDAWLRHWKRYLKRQGVRFFLGRLDRLVVAGDDSLLPEVTLRSAYRQEAELVVTPNPAGVYEVVLNGVRVELRIAGRITDREVIGLALAQAINDRVDAGVLARHVGAGVIRLAPVVPRGSAFLRVPEAIQPVARRVWFNGVEIDVNPDLAGVVLGTQLVDALQEQILEFDSRVELGRFGDRSLRIDPTGGAIVSVVSAARGEIGIEIRSATGLFSVSVRNHRAYDPAVPGEWVGGLRTLRDALVTELRRLALEVEDFGENGLWIRGVDPADVLLARYTGRVQLGVDLQALPAMYAFESCEAGMIAMVAFQPGTATIGPIPEEPEHEYVAAGTPSVPAPGAGPDFYFLALSYLEAARLVNGAHDPMRLPLDGCLEQFRLFNNKNGVTFTEGQLDPVPREPDGRPVPPVDLPDAHYPLRELTGIQYYFNNHIRFGRGHTYYLEAPWGLSSISQLAYWRERASERSAFLGQLSVDIGSFYCPLDSKGEWRRSGWNSSRDEIADQVWKQIITAANRSFGPGKDFKELVASPGYYHLDANLRFDSNETTRHARAIEIALADVAASHVYSLRIDHHDVTTPPTNDPQVIAAAIEAAPRLAIGVSPTKLVVAPTLGKVSSAHVVVSKTIAGVRYALQIGGERLEYVARTEDVLEVRGALVRLVNAAGIGAIATAAADEGIGPPATFVISLATPQDVSALGCAIVYGVLEHHLEIEPTGEMHAWVGAGLSIATEPAVIINATPFMINPPKTWKDRPGLDPTVPRPPDDEGHPTKAAIWYEPTRTRWLMVGNHMATHTRISTMESANESARHAVLSALHEMTQSPKEEGLFNSSGVLFAQMPDVWDPAELEPDDVAPLKRVDDRLCKQGQPHPFDILRLESWVDGLPEDLLHDDLPGHVEALFRGVDDQLQTDWKASGIDDLIGSVREAVKAIFDVD